MATLKPRNRVVVFRLTQDEYKSFKQACGVKGGRNLSEFTRSQLLASLHSDSLVALIEERFVDLTQKLAKVQQAIDSLARLLAGALT